jgi:hypothetical protein
MALVARHQMVSLARVDSCLENKKMLMNEQLLILAARHPNGKSFPQNQYRRIYCSSSRPIPSV